MIIINYNLTCIALWEKKVTKFRWVIITEQNSSYKYEILLNKKN